MRRYGDITEEQGEGMQAILLAGKKTALQGELQGELKFRSKALTGHCTLALGRQEEDA